MEHELNLLCKVHPRVQTSYYKAKDGWLGKDVKWTYPPRGKYKINMDSMLIKPQNETRLVVIIRNEGEEYLQLLVKRKKINHGKWSCGKGGKGGMKGNSFCKERNIWDHRFYYTPMTILF